MIKPAREREALFRAGRLLSPPHGRQQALRSQVLRRAVGVGVEQRAGSHMQSYLHGGRLDKSGMLAKYVLGCAVVGGAVLLTSTPLPDAAKPASITQSQSVAPQVSVISPKQPSTTPSPQSELKLPTPQVDDSHAASAAPVLKKSTQAIVQPAKRRAAAQSSASSGAPELAQDFSEELVLLQRAQQALNAGNGVQALSLLDEHTKQYPETRLLQERRASRVFALCKLQRTEQARREAAQFMASYPKSPLRLRVEQACGSR